MSIPKKIRTTAAIVIMLIAAGSVCSAAQMVFKGTDDIDDNMLHSGVPDTNYGTINILNVGDTGDPSTIKRRIVLRFNNLSELEGLYDSIDSVTWKPGVYPVATGSDFDYGLYEIKAANAGWEETDSSWNHKTKSGGVGWVGGPGLGEPGDGYEAAPVVAQTYDSDLAAYSSISVPLPPALIDDWITGAKANAGLLIREITENDGHKGGFLSSKYIEVAGELVVEYTPVFASSDFRASFSDPYERLEREEWLDDGDGNTVDRYEITTLKGEYQAVGLTLTNCRDSNVACSISITDLGGTTFDYDIRRQVFINTWYPDVGQIADPLTLLSKNGDNWEIDVPADAVAKLYIELRIPEEASGINEASIIVQTPAGSEELFLSLNVLPASPPNPRLHSYCSFMYPWLNVGKNYSALTAADLAEHRTVMMEFPGIPNAVFTTDGDIVSVDFSFLEPRLSAYGPYVDRLMIFWNKSSYNNYKCNEGAACILEPYTESWKNAYRNLLRAWLDHAAGMGFDVDHFVIMPFDEAHSESFDVAPDDTIDNFITVCNLIRQVEPNLPIVATLSDYAGPTDVNAILPSIDIALPVWPYRPITLAGQSPGYNPRQTYYSTIYPMLEQWRESTGGQIWSYHISGGKSDNVRISHRAYPILVAAQGQTGTGTWAYNVTAGKTWDDEDGGILDYSLIYDGTENHLLNQTYNVTGEIIVPSIRWRALRAGIQDAALLTYLKNIQPMLDAVKQAEIQLIIEEAGAMAYDFLNSQWSTATLNYWRHIEDYDGVITFPYLADYSRRLRLLYASTHAEMGDINGDGMLDLEDLLILNEQWLRPPGHPSADIAPSPGGDDKVNFQDFAYMALCWMGHNQ